MNHLSNHATDGTVVYPLTVVARRIQAGVHPQLAIKDHIHEWNDRPVRALFLDEPDLCGEAVYDTWIAAAGEYEAFLLNEPPPSWTRDASRFLTRPVFAGTVSSRSNYFYNTPFAWRRRNLFIGQTLITRPPGASNER